MKNVSVNNASDSNKNSNWPATSSPVLYVGVTGHRDIDPDAIPSISQSTESVLKSLMHHAGKRIFLSSLAEGADQMAAEVAVALGYELQVPLPFNRDSYIATFSMEDKKRFEALESAATKEFFVVPIEDNIWNLPIKDWCYRQAGLYIANKSDVLIALWDGQPTKGSKCGTADIVEYTERLNLRRRDQKSRGKEIIRILTPRVTPTLQTRIDECDDGIRPRIHE